MNINKFVDKIYVINMDKDIDNLINVNNILMKYNINYTRFSGIDVTKLSKNYINKYVLFKNVLTNSIMGCAISHIKIWEEVIKNNYKYVLILEDDIYIENDFYEVLNNAYTELPNNFDILYLGSGGLCNPEYNYTDINLIFKIFSSCNKYKKKYIYKPEFPLYTHAYIISNQGCKKLLKYINKIYNHIDVMIALNSNKLNIYATNKKIVYQSFDESSNSNYNFPKYINNVLSKYKDNNRTPYNYILNTVIIKLGPHNINAITIILFAFGMLSYNNNNLLALILLMFLFENFNNQSTKSGLIFLFLGYILVFLYDFFKKKV